MVVKPSVVVQLLCPQRSRRCFLRMSRRHTRRRYRVSLLQKLPLVFLLRRHRPYPLPSLLLHHRRFRPRPRAQDLPPFRPRPRAQDPPPFRPLLHLICHRFNRAKPRPMNHRAHPHHCHRQRLRRHRQISPQLVRRRAHQTSPLHTRANFPLIPRPNLRPVFRLFLQAWYQVKHHPSLHRSSLRPVHLHPRPVCPHGAPRIIPLAIRLGHRPVYLLWTPRLLPRAIHRGHHQAYLLWTPRLIPRAIHRGHHQACLL